MLRQYLLRGTRTLKSLPRFGSQAYYLHTLTRSRKELYKQFGFTEKEFYTDAGNLVDFLGELETESNMRSVIDQLNIKEIRSLFSDTSELNKIFNKRALSILLGRLGRDTLEDLYKTPHDLISLYRCLGKSGWNLIPRSNFIRIIKDKKTLSDMCEYDYSRDYSSSLPENERCHKWDFFSSYLDYSSIKAIIMSEEKDKKNITPVLDWLNKELWNDNPFPADPWRKARNFPAIENFPPHCFKLIICHVDELIQTIRYFKSLHLTLSHLVWYLRDCMEAYVQTIFDYEKLHDCTRCRADCIPFSNIFNLSKIENLIIKTMQENPDFKFIDYKNILSSCGILKDYPSYIRIETFNILKDMAATKEADVIPRL